MFVVVLELRLVALTELVRPFDVASARPMDAFVLEVVQVSVAALKCSLSLVQEAHSIARYGCSSSSEVHPNHHGVR